MRSPFNHEMSVTRADFLRLLPAAVGGVEYVEEHNAFLHRDQNCSWRITLEPMPELQLGLVRLDRQRVRLEFEGYAEADIASFMTRFEMYFRRGGG